MKRPRNLKIRRRASVNGSRRAEVTLETGPEIAATSLDNSRVAEFTPEKFKKDMAALATNVWKARSRIVDPGSGEVREEMKRVYGDIERIQRCLDNLGIAVEDHTNKPFDYGLPWQVVATKPMAGLAREIVTETLKPTVRWNQQIIQHAEVEIGTPV